MHFKSYLLSSTALALALEYAHAAPAQLQNSSQVLSNTTYGPIPDEDPYYSNYTGKATPFPANFTAPVLPTTKGPPAPDDQLWQNLLGAEYVVFSLYQQGVERFNASSFTTAGFPNTTYQRILEIRDNEAGHLRIFQDQISSNSIKPGPCKYTYPFTTPEDYLSIVSLIEISSMAYLTGLVQEAELNSAKAALLAVGETESRHNTWSLIDIWGISPFAGPTDTAYPYANQILDLTHTFIVDGSCPPENPIYPNPRQNLPRASIANGTKGVTPGSNITFDFPQQTNQPKFSEDKEYYTVFFHGLNNITVPFDTKTNSTTIPSAFEAKGIIIVVITDTPGAPTLDSCIAGPEVLLQQPAQLGLGLA